VGVEGRGSVFESRDILVNTKPAVNAVTASPSIISTGSVSLITCAASDADLDALTYSWSSVEGSTLVVSADSATWTAPVSTGLYSVTCSVSDNRPGGTAEKSVSVQVATGPLITNMSVSPGTVPKLGQTYIVCEATAPDNGAMAYFWSVSSGTIAAAYASSAAWTAPDATGTYVAGCEVRVAGRDSAFAYGELVVNTPPTLSALTAAPSLVSTGSVAALTCAASDPDGDELVYTWTSVEGSTLVVSADSATWTAPVSTGSYSVTCAVSDGKADGTAQLSVAVRVATGPVITLMNVNPDRVPKLGSSYVICEATAPDSGALVYTWTKSGGTITDVFPSSAAWQAPDSTGTYSVGCEVAVTGHGSVFDSRAIVVNTPPVMNWVTGQPDFISTMTVSTITCSASDADGDTLSYEWTALSGSTKAVAGDGSQVEWTSPASSGTYAITCKALDAQGGEAQLDENIEVSSIPVIDSLTADTAIQPPSLSTGAQTTLDCAARGPGGETVAYDWYASSGSTQSVAGNGHNMLWTAPVSTGTYSVTCAARGGAGFAQQSLPILVNNPPRILSVSADPATVSSGTVSTITCVAVHPDGPITYAWSKSTGTFNLLDPWRVEWTAPAAAGTYNIGCKATDEDGGFDDDSAAVTVTVRLNLAPTISLVAADPEVVSKGAVSTITCTAVDPENSALAYDWYASGGSTGTIAGGVSSITWTAPLVIGTYTVGCTVSDGEGGTDSDVGLVTVSTMPVISTVTATLDWVTPGSSVMLTCVAKGPDKEIPSYTWHADNGSLEAVSGHLEQITWTAPVSSGTYAVRCTATGAGGFAEADKHILVNTPPYKKAPLSAAPSLVSPLGISTVTCTVEDADSDPLTYTWQAQDGSTSPLSADASTVAWRAPASSGTYTITCTASDGKIGGVVTGSVDVLVGTAPVITGLTADPSSVLAGGVSTVTCSAYDPDSNDPLTYNWSASGGSLKAYVSSAAWTAPASSGTYSVTCEAQSGGGSAVAAVNITARFSRLWTRQPGSVANDAGYAVAVDTTSGNVYIAGEVNEHLEFGTTWYGSNDAFLSKYDTDGSVLWSVQLGSANVDQGRAAAVDTHGNVIIAGNSDRPLLLKDAFIVKYDPAGNMVWFRSTGTDTDDTAYGVAVDSAGSVYVVGETAGAFTKPYAGGASDIFMVKYSSAGALLKKYQYGTTGNDSAYAVAIDTSGYVYVTGRTGGRLVPGATYYGGLDSFLSKFDNSLNPVWTVQLGISAADIARGVTVDSDGKIWVTGYTNGNLAGPTNGGTDIFLARYDANGSTLTLKQLGTTAEDRGWAIAAYPGYVYISGEVGAAFPGNTYAGDADIFLAKYNNSGVEAWAQPQQYGSSAVSLDISYGLGADHDGNAFLAGKTMGEIDGNSQNGLSDIFVTKYSPDN